METVKLTIDNQNIVCDRPYLVSDTVNVYECEFTFDEEWEGFVKWAVFKQNGVAYKVLLQNDKCLLPSQAIRDRGYMQIGVYGVDGERHYPTIYTLPIQVQLGCDDGEEPEPTPSQWEQALAYMAKIDEIELTKQDIVDYISLERLGNYLFKITFENIPEEEDLEFNIPSGCTSYVKDGKLYRNLDWNYDEVAQFLVVTKDFEGMGYLSTVNDGDIDEKKIAQLPYHLNDGRNKYGIMISSHVLFNDFGFVGSGNTPLSKIPYLVLSNLKSMSNISSLQTYLDDIKVNQQLIDADYLIQYLVTDGVTSYVITPTSSGYQLVNITSNPKLTNFKWVNREIVDRTESDIQYRPTGIERWNMIPATLEELKFTNAYTSPTRLSEFIGLRGTTKASSDDELLAIYQDAHQAYLDRTRDGTTWQTVHSIVYSINGIENLWVQEDFNVDYIGKQSGGSPASSVAFADITGQPRDNLQLKTELETIESASLDYEEHTNLPVFNGKVVKGSHDGDYYKVVDSDNRITNTQIEEIFGGI